MEKIVSVAIKAKEGLIFSLPKPNRHVDIIRLLFLVEIDPLVASNGEEGFLTSEGRFVDRIEAAQIALFSGQVAALLLPPKLRTEDLW